MEVKRIRKCEVKGKGKSQLRHILLLFEKCPPRS